MRTIAAHNVALQAGGWLSSLGRTVRHRYSDWAEHRRAMATARALYYATDMKPSNARIGGDGMILSCRNDVA
jgi:hypothetical protein